MARISWNDAGSRLYSAGVDRGVLYPAVGSGVPWNGLLSVDESETEGDSVINHIDGIGFLSRQKPGTFAASIQAYSYPDELEYHDGVVDRITGQPRHSFGFSYRTFTGNDIEGLDYGYQIHIVYNALLDPSDRGFSTIGQGISPAPFTWDLSSQPVAVPGHRGSAHFVIDSRIVYPWVLTEIEETLYGSPSLNASLPSYIQLFDIFENGSILKITDHGDGTWSAEGPDEIFAIAGDYFEITWPSAVWLSEDTFRISSL